MTSTLKRTGALAAAVFGAVAFGVGTAYAAVGDDTVDDVDNDAPADVLNFIKDYGFENAPTIVGIIGAIFLLGLTFMLIRRGLGRVRGIFGKV